VHHHLSASVEDSHLVLEVASHHLFCPTVVLVSNPTLDLRVSFAMALSVVPVHTLELGLLEGVRPAHNDKRKLKSVT
jgi:hypothetical protein